MESMRLAEKICFFSLETLRRGVKTANFRHDSASGFRPVRPQNTCARYTRLAAANGRPDGRELMRPDGLVATNGHRWAMNRLKQMAG